MLKKLITRRFKLSFVFCFSSISFFILSVHSAHAVEEVTSISSPPHTSFTLLNEEVFIHKGELSYGKLEKRQEFLSWPILDREGIKKTLLKALAKESLAN